MHFPATRNLRFVSLVAGLALCAGCTEGQKPTPLKRFDTNLVPSAEKKDKEPEAQKAKSGLADKGK